MSRCIRTGAALVLLLGLATHNQAAGTASDRAAKSPIPISFQRVPLDASAPERRRLDSLEYLGGWVLSSADPRLGGISTMHVDGRRVIAVSDTGLVSSFPVPSGREGEVRARLASLAGGPADEFLKKNRDSEAMAVQGGRAWIAFERRNAVWRYRIGDWRGEEGAEPSAMAEWPRNGGAEAMVRLHDGRFLILAEKARRADGSLEALLFDGDPSVPDTRSETLSYRAPAGYRPTEVAQLPDGRLLILNRSFSSLAGASAKLVLARLNRQRLVAERELATLRPPVTVDNMEALSITREGTRTILWIASDDNFSPPLQRTILMKFALLD